MSIEWLFVLIGLWVLVGLVNAWVLYRRGRRGWQWSLACVTAGPLSISFVFDQVSLVEPETPTIEPAPSNSEVDQPVDQSPDDAADWPEDDPEGRFVLLGYRGLSDH